MRLADMQREDQDAYEAYVTWIQVNQAKRLAYLRRLETERRILNWLKMRRGVWESGIDTIERRLHAL